jgi:hypothetical protein
VEGCCGCGKEKLNEEVEVGVRFLFWSLVLMQMRIALSSRGRYEDEALISIPERFRGYSPIFLLFCQKSPEPSKLQSTRSIGTLKKSSPVMPLIPLER